MPKPRKKIKHLEVSHHKENRKPDSAAEDFVGKFLVGAFTAIITALASQAITNQINWVIVALVVVVALVVLVVYQRGK